MSSVFIRWLRRPAKIALPKLTDWRDQWYLTWDKKQIRRTRNLRLIPGIAHRFGGKRSYAEWAHIIGIFQTLINLYLDKPSKTILDIGCGTGLLAIACEPFVQKDGRYIGIDVIQSNIDFCRQHYTEAYYEFQHVPVYNGMYASLQPKELVPWNLENASIDMVTALSVWTHMLETEAIFYFGEIDRVLKPGGKAIVTFFLLDDQYDEWLRREPTTANSCYHMTNPKQWIFDVRLSESGDWRHPSWVHVPEKVIGITPVGIQKLTDNTELNLKLVYTGNWKEVPGMFFQDILIFEKQG